MEFEAFKEEVDKNIESLFNKANNDEKRLLNRMINTINDLCKENQKLKEEKRLILKDISFWIRNSKVEQIEGDMTHARYWMYFEDIVNKIFKKYNTENLSDEDLKYNHYLEKENEELIREVQQKEYIINKAKELIKEMSYGGNEDYYMENFKTVLEILEKSDK